MNENLQDKLTLLVKSEKTLLRLELRKKVRQGVLIAIAVIALFIALSALNIALYFYLESFVTPIQAALIIGGSNTVLAFILLFIASNLGLGEDEKSAYEIRDFARLQVKHEVENVRENYFSVKNTFSGLLSLKRALQLVSLFKKGKK